MPQKKNILITAIHHQNNVGWDLFLKGYTSTYWVHTQFALSGFTNTLSNGKHWDF
jgi:hypothetical protein